jgi:hypothetical protein
MPRLTADKWMEARAYYEAGANQLATSDKFGVSRKAIQKHIESEGWTQDLEDAVRRKVAEKSLGKVAGCNPHETAKAIDAEAERRVQVSRRHEKMWEQATALHQQALGRAFDGKTFSPDPALQRAAKLNADTVAIIVNGERKIYKLDDDAYTPGGTSGKWIVEIVRPDR